MYIITQNNLLRYAMMHLIAESKLTLKIPGVLIFIDLPKEEDIIFLPLILEELKLCMCRVDCRVVVMSPSSALHRQPALRGLIIDSGGTPETIESQILNYNFNDSSIETLQDRLINLKYRLYLTKPHMVVAKLIYCNIEIINIAKLIHKDTKVVYSRISTIKKLSGHKTNADLYFSLNEKRKMTTLSLKKDISIST